MEILGFMAIDIIISGIGFLCLFVWYRNRKKVEQIKNEKYAGSYGAAGRIMILNFIAGAGAICLFVFLIFSIATWMYRLLTD